MNHLRDVVFYGSYYMSFYYSLRGDVQKKFDYVLFILATQQRIPTSQVKHIEGSDGIYEIIVSSRSDEYRVLFFFESLSLIEGGKVVVVGNGFIKKDKKDYKKAVEIAEAIKSAYLKEKGI